MRFKLQVVKQLKKGRLMQKKGLKKAPLIHSVIQLRFSTIPEIKIISEENLSKLHNKMIEQNFPEQIKAKFNQLLIKFEGSAQKTIQTETEMFRYLFRSEGEREIIEISSNEAGTALTLKSGAYTDFKRFYQKFYKFLTICIEVFPKLEEALLKSITLRYVDLIVPSSEYNLSDFVQASVMPMSLDTFSQNKHLHGFSQRYVITDAGYQLKVAFEEIPTADNNMLTKILPDSLAEPDPACGLMIPLQEAWNNIKSPTYGILDIESIKEFQGSPKMNLNFIKTEINALYTDCSDVFWEVITPQAQELWEVYDVTDKN